MYVYIYIYIYSIYVLDMYTYLFTLAEVMGAEISDSLKQKGYAVCKVFVSDEDMENMCSTADRCVDEGAFSRLSSELEPGPQSESLQRSN